MKKCQKYLELPEASVKNKVHIHVSGLERENSFFTSRLQFFLDSVAGRSKK